MGYTVLLVDDHSELLDLLARSLDRLGGFTMLRAADGVAALEQAVTLRPDCVVADVLMPHLNGLHLIRALRGDPETANIPLIILSALAQSHDRFAGLAAGADRYLVKPVTLPEIVAVIHEVIALDPDERARRFCYFAEQMEDDEP